MGSTHLAHGVQLLVFVVNEAVRAVNERAVATDETQPEGDRRLVRVGLMDRPEAVLALLVDGEAE